MRASGRSWARPRAPMRPRGARPALRTGRRCGARSTARWSAPATPATRRRSSSTTCASRGPRPRPSRTARRRATSSASSTSAAAQADRADPAVRRTQLRRLLDRLGRDRRRRPDERRRASRAASRRSAPGLVSPTSTPRSPRTDVLVPGGSCPTVGISGLALGGGNGVVSRNYGLTADRLQSLQIVTADGSVLDPDASNHSDLYWACRGGGGRNFGVATSFRFRTSPVPALALFTIDYPWAAAGDLVTRGWTGSAMRPTRCGRTCSCSPRARAACSPRRPASGAGASPR